MTNFFRLPKLPPEAIRDREEAVRKRDAAKRKKLESLGMLTSIQSLADKINEVNNHNDFRGAIFDTDNDDC